MSKLVSIGIGIYLCYTTNHTNIGIALIVVPVIDTILGNMMDSWFKN
jgi:hypothetical protein